MEKNIYNFNEFFRSINENSVNRDHKTFDYDGFISLIKEGRGSKATGYLIGDSTVASISRSIKGIGKQLQEGSIKGGNIKPGLWCSGVGTNAYLKMIDGYTGTHPEATYVFLAMGTNDAYVPTNEIKNNAIKIKNSLRRIFPNVVKFFIIKGTGWGWGEKYKDNYPKWMWKGWDIKNGPTEKEPVQISQYYNEVWTPAGFTLIPVNIGIDKNKEGYAKHIGPRTPGVAELAKYIENVLDGRISVYKEEIEDPKEMKSAQSGEIESPGEFYDYFENAINNKEERASEASGVYSFDPLVERAQLGLKFLGFDLPIHGADGIFGPETEGSVVGFKKKFEVPGNPKVMDEAFFNSLMARLKSNNFDTESIKKVISASRDMGSYDVGDTDLGKGESSWVYWLSHNQGAAGAAELLKVALGSKNEFSPNGKKWFMEGWIGRGNHIKGNVGNKGWDGEYKKRIKAAYDQGNDQLVAKLFTEYQKKKFDQMVERGKTDLPKHPDIKSILDRYSKYFPIEFLAAVAGQESNFDPKEGNSKYKGLFALDPNSNYAKKYGLNNSNVHDPEKNTEVAVKFWGDNRKELKKYLSPQEIAALGIDKTGGDLA